jgi:hypothetical protein
VEDAEQHFELLDGKGGECWLRTDGWRRQNPANRTKQPLAACNRLSHKCKNTGRISRNGCDLHAYATDIRVVKAASQLLCSSCTLLTLLSAFCCCRPALQADSAASQLHGRPLPSSLQERPDGRAKWGRQESSRKRRCMNAWVRTQWVAVTAVVNSSALTAYGSTRVPVHGAAGKYASNWFGGQRWCSLGCHSA